MFIWWALERDRGLMGRLIYNQCNIHHTARMFLHNSRWVINYAHVVMMQGSMPTTTPLKANRQSVEYFYMYISIFPLGNAGCVVFNICVVYMYITICILFICILLVYRNNFRLISSCDSRHRTVYYSLRTGQSMPWGVEYIHGRTWFRLNNHWMQLFQANRA